jgi:hypothetical protein
VVAEIAARLSPEQRPTRHKAGRPRKRLGK